MSIAQRSINVLRRYANTKGQDQIAAGVFETTANEIERMIDRIAALEAQLEAARKDGEKNAKRVKWMLPLLGGDDSPEADKRTLLLANELMRGKSGLEAIDAALEATTTAPGAVNSSGGA